MSYALLVRKLERMGGGYLSAEELRRYSAELGLEYLSAVGYLNTNKYLIRIMRGVFYVKSVGERKLDSLNVNHYEAIKKAMEYKKVGNWYFGLETAVSLNNLTHEYYTTTYVVTDSVSRPKPYDILGHKVKFIKVSKKLFGFGVINEKIPYSDPEKTVLDLIYLSKYAGLSDAETKNRITDLIKHCSKKKLAEYSKKYPKTVKRLAEDADSILSEEDYSALNNCCREKKEGKLVSHEKLKKELGLSG